MNWIRFLPLTAAFTLSACGGGGGGVNGTPAPPPPTPAPTNTTMTDLKASQSFRQRRRIKYSTFDLTTKTTITGKNAPGALTISYDAGNNSYSVAIGGRTQIFTSSDKVSDDPDQTLYRKTDDGLNYLTLVKIPYTGTTPTQYVGMGYLQRNVLSGANQNSEFSTFTYGLDTPSAAVPDRNRSVQHRRLRASIDPRLSRQKLPGARHVQHGLRRRCLLCA